MSNGVRKQDRPLWDLDSLDAVCMLAGDASKPFCRCKFLPSTGPPADAAGNHLSSRRHTHTTAAQKAKPTAKRHAAKAATSCVPGRCKDNPNCLNYVGQSAWLAHPKAAFEAFAKQAAGLHLSDSLENELRQPNTPVGFKNLGATCYLGSLLQIWFHNLDFRSIVYSHAPNDQHSAMCVLAQTFAQLQLTASRAIKPSQLIDLMALDPAVQQDALEFSKLFLSLLESATNAPLSGSPSRPSTLSQLLQGEYQYVTKCRHCASESTSTSAFHELEVDISTRTSLVDCVDLFLASETLDSANQYFCNSCNAKQDADRSIRLSRLPKMLNFQINRFRFDPKLMAKKKINKPIYFPRRIDMSPHVAGSEPNSLVYELQAVLLHRGWSANSGHYVASVFCPETNKWCMFDDDHVGISDSPSFQISGVGSADSGDELVQSSPRSSSKPGPAAKRRATTAASLKTATTDADAKQPSTHTSETVYSSTAAYLLTYVRIDRRHGQHQSTGSPSDSTAASTPPGDGANVDGSDPLCVASKPSSAVPDWLVAGIEQANARLQSEVQEWLVKKSAVQAKFDDRLEAWKRVFAAWSITSNHVPFVYVSASALTDAVKREVTAPQAKTNAGGASSDDPLVVRNDEWIASAGQDQTTNALASSVLSNADLLCEHSRLHPARIWMTKRISMDGYQQLLAMGMALDPYLDKDSVCRECYDSIRSDLDTGRQHDVDVQFVLARLHGRVAEGEQRFFVSKAWLNAWKKHSRKSASLPSPNDAGFLQDVWCPHGQLSIHSSTRVLVPAKVYSLLLERFPDLHMPTEDEVECSSCLNEHSDRLEEHRPMQTRAKNEKEMLKRLADKRSIRLASNELYYAVPTAFLASWRRFLREPLATAEHSALCVDTTRLLCEQHAGLLYDFKTDNPKETVATLVTSEEWDVLSTLYTIVGHPITIQVEPLTDAENAGATKQLVCHPPVCWDCRGSRILSYETAEIRVVKKRSSALANGSDVHAVGNSSPGRPDGISVAAGIAEMADSDGPDPLVAGRKRPRAALEQATAGGVRKSQRLRGEQMVTTSLTPDMLVKDLKLKLMAHFHIPPLYQQLSYHGMELKADDATMRQIGILPGDTIELRVFEEPDEPDFQDVLPAQVEVGFAGTALTGHIHVPLIRDADTTASRPTDTVVEHQQQSGLAPTPTPGVHAPSCGSSDDPIQWSCRHCTFLNPATAESCTMCGLGEEV
ncbi:hypothetical protein BC831DRAFT_474792 [Entophlyctis helioformis]|nr:hypothetical protein BC831DRAFT_474792 [Entophlyctis helioformis]